ncbi:universal stress protein [Marixanthomonas spongiae]|uniref:Universal stress protein n=1 Tax=Marixanthomonas spongiae TaxID=2174845 RepID=A0A2U0HUU5_9FLAO|nr:universal stress protein [Marixanthomonas spongiae]PVW12642.1 universal stress protein [Marixanthomonas spongiae]
MKNIIIPVDFSETSEYALKAGAKLAKRHGSTLHVLHMLELADSILIKSETENTNKMLFLLNVAKRNFESFLDKPYLEGIDVKPVVKHYKVFKEVDAVSKEVNADLIVMGSRGITLQDGIFAGSNAEKMVRNSSTPVMIIKRDPKEFDLNKVILATAMNPDNVATFKKAMNTLKILGCDVYPVYVNTPGNDFISSKEFYEQARMFQAAGGSSDIQFIAGHTVEDGITQYADEINADLIAISTHARKGLNHFFRGSISEDLANRAKLPVMTFKL